MVSRARNVLRAAVIVTLAIIYILQRRGIASFGIYLHTTEAYSTPTQVPVLSTEDDSTTPKISLDDIYVTVKTCGRYHEIRDSIILKTWWNIMKDQTYFFTDTEDQSLRNRSDDHVVVTKCGKTHNWFELCCKMGYEYDSYYESNKTWWCHVDDDNYLNPSKLLDALNEYDWRKPMYVGRPSREGDQIHKYKRKKVKLRFVTGGAGVCITRIMAERMSPWMRHGEFEKTCRDLNQPDDVTLGFVATNRLQVSLTRRNDFNSHLQRLNDIPSDSLLSQVVLSYSAGPKNEYQNVINLTEEMSVFPFEQDKTRLLSYHCSIYPKTEWCPRNSGSL